MTSDEAEKPRDGGKTVLPDWMAGGPHGVGDPNDRRLRNVERNVLIPKIVRERAQKEKCNDLFMNFLECSKRTGFLVIFKCRKERDIMNECLGKWFHDEDFKNECKEQYLAERKVYRETGIPKAQRTKDRVV
ncbi:COX assembly mitochondrial protein homolog [Galendromus occidentalis]|uniref:COX assembly mitochondrial protein n=1 Tax=Galendromus occidentalis TaxID=34638 RepID=A0AAJ6QNA0_9ACAR|nr:COX assembly mitochondrial protein homolog [Galendromus occidentalis]